jgi:hypothetical protein
MRGLSATAANGAVDGSDAADNAAAVVGGSGGPAEMVSTLAAQGRAAIDSRRLMASQA